MDRCRACVRPFKWGLSKLSQSRRGGAAEMRMKWDTDRIVAVSAMLVGLGSLFIVLYQTTLMREQSKASVLPYLLIAFNTNNDGSYIALKNVGLGPALIEPNSNHPSGQSVRRRPLRVLRVAGRRQGASEQRLPRPGPAGHVDPCRQQSQYARLRRPIPDELELLRTFQFVAVEDGPSSGEGSATAPEKAVLEIEYSSVYGEHWRVRWTASFPTRSEPCALLRQRTSGGLGRARSGIRHGRSRSLLRRAARASGQRSFDRRARRAPRGDPYERLESRQRVRRHARETRPK